jgi:hypothetical protein
MTLPGSLTVCGSRVPTGAAGTMETKVLQEKASPGGLVEAISPFVQGAGIGN